VTVCDLFDSPDIELYFYNELDAVDRARVEVHVLGCAGCRQRLDDLRAIRRALASRPVVEAPPAGDWSGFMRRLDAAVASEGTRKPVGVRVPESAPGRLPTSRAAARRSWLRPAMALAAMLALVTIGVAIAARFRASSLPPAQPAAVSAAAPTPPDVKPNPNRSLREVTAEHLERSKLVVLGLATRDPGHTSSSDWEYERQLAGSLLNDTRLYRLQAQDRGLTDVAGVMRDLETVLIEASMTEKPDRDALERVQRLITKRDLVVKMQVVAANSAGL
jgi:putative zinc finger protein